jgi:hypothetical protein
MEEFDLLKLQTLVKGRGEDGRTTQKWEGRDNTAALRYRQETITA